MTLLLKIAFLSLKCHIVDLGIVYDKSNQSYCWIITVLINQLRAKSIQQG